MRREIFFTGILFILSILGISTSVMAETVLLPVAQLAREKSPRYFVISIGINQYRDPFWPALKWPVTDASTVLERLGNNTEFDVVRFPLLNEAASIDAVTTTLQQVAAQVTERDVVLLYMSGHGTLTQSITGELERVVVLYDTDKERLFTTGLRHSILNDWLERLKANRKMIIYATCHSGIGKSRIPDKVRALLGTAKGALIPLRDVSHGALVLSAAAQGEAAYENDVLQGDIYTHYLLEALDVDDRNKDGVVSALEAHDYARDRTWEFTKGSQRPTLHADLVGDADIPLTGVKTGTGLPVLTAYDKSLSGFFVQIDDGMKGRLPMAFPLNPKGSRVVLYTPENLQVLRAYHVNAIPGQQVTLNHVMNDRPLNIGFSAKQLSWSDHSWEKVSGSSTSNAYETQLGYQFDPIEVGVIYSYTQDQHALLQPGIKSDVSLSSQFLYAEYHVKYRSVIVGARYELGYESMDISLTDQFTGHTLPYDDSTTSQGLALMVTYNVASDFFVTGGAGFRTANWDFGTIGDITGDRKWFSLGVDYRFSFNARTLW